MLKRFLYLGYYFKELDWAKFNHFLNYIANNTSTSKLRLVANSIISSLKYNISISEYFLFKFYEISNEEKKAYAGTGYMYEYQKLMNPKTSRNILENKLIFLEVYKDFIKHNFISLEQISKSNKLDKVLQNKTGKIVLKKSDGQCGEGIEVRESKDFTKKSLINRLRETGNDFVEDFVLQHKKLNELSPSGLNTVRIITQLDKNNNVDILGARLRITINSSVDNLAAGNTAAPIDLKTGTVNGLGVFSDITKDDIGKHPVTNVSIIGFKIPFWEESISMVTRAALLHKENRSIGWDVAITDDGPELIEGNHDWCKLLWQLPVKKGLKPILEKYRLEK